MSPQQQLQSIIAKRLIALQHRAESKRIVAECNAIKRKLLKEKQDRIAAIRAEYETQIDWLSSEPEMILDLE